MSLPPTQLRRILALPIFRGLTEAETQALLALAEPLHLELGEALFEEGAPGDALYIVLTGHIAVLKRDPSGEQQQLARVGDGSVLGEMTLVAGNAGRSASARALSAATLLRIPAARFQRLVHTDHLPALKVVHNLAQVMSRRLLLMDEKLVGLLDRGRKREELAEFQRILNDWAF